MAVWDHIMMTLAATASVPYQSDEKPLQLQLIAQGEFVEFEVVGASDQAIVCTYELDVQGDSFTRTKGVARLVAGKRIILSKVRVRQQNGWSATLSVQGDARYKIVATSE